MASISPIPVSAQLDFAACEGVLPQTAIPQDCLDMMVDIRDTINEMIVSGMHLEEVLAARPTAEYDEQWGQVATWNAKDIVPVIYSELGGGPTLPRGSN